jgi:hypothetical protein
MEEHLFSIEVYSDDKAMVDYLNKLTKIEL